MPKRRRNGQNATKAGELEAEIKTLMREVAKEERSVKDGKQCGVRATAYDRLAKIYRKQKAYADEVAIIRRFIEQPKAPGRSQEALPGRLEKAESLAVKSTSTRIRHGRSSKKDDSVQPPSSQFVAFDIEIAKVLPAATYDLKQHRPLGVCCAAVLEGPDDEPHLWYSRMADGTYAPQMSRHDLRGLVTFLSQLVENGATIVTWNGLGFDFDILAEESGLYEDCRTLALNHVDMMFHVVCEKGFAVSLNAACGALGIGAKMEGIKGADVPKLWRNGQYETVLRYVAHDCLLTLQVHQSGARNRRFEWITQKGSRSKFSLPHGWLKVCYAVNIPLPDTSWMSSPLPRGHYFGWTTMQL